MSKLDIAIVGEINLDLILYGLPEQMATERELLASGFAITLGSSSAILAHNLAAVIAELTLGDLSGHTGWRSTCATAVFAVQAAYLGVKRCAPSRRITSPLT